MARSIGLSLPAPQNLSGDWGDLHLEDVGQNNRAMSARDRLVSSYYLPEPQQVDTNFGNATSKSVWIITDPGWHTTTILRPVEY